MIMKNFLRLSGIPVDCAPGDCVLPGLWEAAQVGRCEQWLLLLRVTRLVSFSSMNLGGQGNGWGSSPPRAREAVQLILDV